MQTLVAGLAIASVVPAVRVGELVFKPVEGAEVHKAFEEATSWTLESMEAVVDGAPVRANVPEMVGRISRQLALTDTYERVEDGVVTKLSREFESVAGVSAMEFAVEGMESDSEIELVSDLAGARVLFTRKDANSELVAKWADDKASGSELLAGLREDLDLRAVLTEVGLGVGDHWTVDAATLADLLAPGGELHLDPTGDAGDVQAGIDATELVGTTLCGIGDNARKLAGEVLCTWKETKKEGGSELAIVELEWESTAQNELAELLQRRCKAAGIDTAREDMALTMAWTTEGTGQLVWDLAAGRAHSCELALESKVDTRFDWSENGVEFGYRFTLAVQSKLTSVFSGK